MSQTVNEQLEPIHRQPDSRIDGKEHRHLPGRPLGIPGRLSATSIIRMRLASNEKWLPFAEGQLFLPTARRGCSERRCGRKHGGAQVMAPFQAPLDNCSLCFIVT